jgi:hypothetical protein
MRKRVGAKTSARSARARRPKSTSARSSSSSGIRKQLADTLSWGHAHVDFDKAVEGIPAEVRGRRPPGLPHSPWEILEHVRIAQEDILDFCRNPQYAERKWPDEYWPSSPEPPDPRAWDASVAAFRRDRDVMRHLATDPKVDLTAKIPHGTGQTFLREVLLILDHNAYHVGELVAARRALGAWGSR